MDPVCSNGTSGGQGGQRDPFCGPWQRWRHSTAQYGNNSNSNAISKSKDKLTTIMIAVTFSAQSLKAIKGEGGYNTHTLHCVSFHEYEEEKRRRTLPFARTLTTHCSIKPGNEDENTETVKR